MHGQATQCHLLPLINLHHIHMILPPLEGGFLGDGEVHVLLCGVEVVSIIDQAQPLSVVREGHLKTEPDLVFSKIIRWSGILRIINLLK